MILILLYHYFSLQPKSYYIDINNIKYCRKKNNIKLSLFSFIDEYNFISVI